MPNITNPLEKLSTKKVNKCPIIDSDSNINEISSITQNVNNDKSTEDKKEIFFATLAHDLKNPLIAQLCSLNLLVNGKFGSINQVQKEILGMIIDSTNFMKEMLCSMLSIYKYENGNIKLNKKPFYIDNLIKKCIKESRYLAEEKNIKIEFLCKNENIRIFADENQIRRAIVNLINNGVNYSYSNSIFKIALTKENTYISITFKNSGARINDDIKLHIFDKFTTGNYSTGVGLGLYYCKKVIESHNGNISLFVNDDTNEFLINLPIKYNDSNNQIKLN